MTRVHRSGLGCRERSLALAAVGVLTGSAVGATASAADSAHELHTPLTVIKGTITGKQEGVFNPDKDHLDAIKEQTYLLTRPGSWGQGLGRK
jgi:signal transduction histidine kinase